MEFLMEGVSLLTWKQLVMYAVGIALIVLAIRKEYEPSLLLPMGFGAILVNLPLSGVLNQVLEGAGENLRHPAHDNTAGRVCHRKLFGGRKHHAKAGGASGCPACLPGESNSDKIF